MFCYQGSFFRPTLPVDEAQFYALVRGTQWKETIDKFRETGDQKLKRGLPAFIFQATFDETESKNGKVGRWRKQAATRLTGLVVMDIDHVEDPHAVYDSWLKVHDLTALGIELVYITPSGKGLKVVFKANVEYNLIDNQHAMAKVLGVEIDEACKDASRMSFICKEEDILFIDKELFTYENKEYGERFDALYRDGRSQGKTKNGDESPSDAPSDTEEKITLEKNEEGEYCYHGVKFREICEAWQASQGGAPVPGDRHRTMLQMALDLRYITDNRPENIVCVLKLCRFVQDIIRERGEEEVRGVADTACDRRLYRDIPKRLQEVLESAGVSSGDSQADGGAVAKSEIPYELFAERLEPLLSPPYSDACRAVERHNWRWGRCLLRERCTAR